MNDVSLRITVTSPTPGVDWAVQNGRDELIKPSEASREAISFDLTVRVGTPLPDGRPRFLGGVAQGPPDARFVYVNSGARAGQAGSCWDRRAKVPLAGITTRLLKSAKLEARFEGRGPDGGPACATVPLLDGGWRPVPPRR